MSEPERAARIEVKHRIGARPLEVWIFASLLVALVTSGSRRLRSASSFRSDAGDVQLNATGDVRLSTAGTLFEVVGRPRSGEATGDVRTVRDARGLVVEGMSFSAVVDGTPMRIFADKPRTTPHGPAHAMAHAVLRDADHELEADLAYTLHRSPTALLVALRLRAPEPHAVSLVATVPTRGATPFVRGTGILADSGDAQGAVTIFEGALGAAAVGAPSLGDMSVHVGPAEDLPESPLVASLTTAPSPFAEIFIVPGATTSGVGEGAARLRNESVRHLHGRVVGGDLAVDVWGVGAEGRPLLHVKPSSDGTFSVVAPIADVGFYATMAHTRASPIVARAPQDNSELELTMLPGGDVRVRVEDPDSGQPLTARLIVHGVAPTADPNFGPDYRASGAGPLMDALRGEATMPLPSGRYRILATHGPEYTIDEQAFDVSPGSTRAVKLQLRHVVDTPGWVGCDLHVHARPSFDSPVLPEDRVLSLISAGVEFAVPSEHNAVGHYEPVLQALDLTRELATVPGVEITTARPSFGHFNVFPYPGPNLPPYRRTTIRQIFLKAREGDPSRVLQVNHPRMKNIGYFDIVGLDAKTGSASHDWREDFDSVEVYNGAEASNRAHVETVLMDWLELLELGHRYVGTGDSDSHRIQYQWAGYPRTYVSLPLEQSGDTGVPIDNVALIAALKAGHVFVTSGPMVEATINGQGPGATIVVGEPAARLHVMVRAAPWIDVSEVEVMLGTTSIARVPVQPKSRAIPPNADLPTARAAMVRFQGDFDVPFNATGSKFVVVVVRGTRALDDVLPFMPIQPLAFSNPIWLSAP